MWVKIPVGSTMVKLIREGDRIVSSIDSGVPFESASLAAWGKMCAGGGTVMDIGAYTGIFSIAARRLGCRVLPFEPMPFNRARFKQNAELNGVSGQVNSEVVSDIVGKTTITYNPIPFTSGASLLRKTGVQLKALSVTVDSLDLKLLHAMKIDVERAEPLVLAGARQTLERLKPSILIEVLDREREKLVLEQISDIYRVSERLDTRNWLMVPK